MCAVRIAEGKKEDSYAALDKTSHAFLPLAFDVFCGTAPRADEFLRRLASIVVTRRTGYSESGTQLLPQLRHPSIIIINMLMPAYQ